MIEKIICNVITDMIPHLSPEQLGHLENSLYIRFHNVDVCEQSYDLTVSAEDSNLFKLKMFIMSKKATNRKDDTLHQYAWEIKNLFTFLNNKNVQDITAMDIRYYYSVLRERRGISMTTMQTRLRYLSSFWDFLMAEELVTRNPIKQIGVVKVEKVIKQPFLSEDLESLREHCNNERDRALVEFLYATGVRVSELTALNVGDVHMDKKELIVNGKGSKERKTYLTDSAKFYLKRYLKSRCIESGLDYEELDNQPLFVSLVKPHGRMSKAGIEYTLRQLGKKANVANVHPHRFRRTIATDLLSRGMPIEEVKVFLGHEKLDTTMIYCTVQDENVKSSYKKYA